MTLLAARPMIKIILFASLLANALLGVGLYQYVEAYADLSHWACEHGNGGAECGEM